MSPFVSRAEIVEMFHVRLMDLNTHPSWMHTQRQLYSYQASHSKSQSLNALVWSVIV